MLGIQTKQSTLSLDDVSLVVFDEVHHLRGVHPYREAFHAIRDYNNLRPSHHVKCLGITATPVFDSML